MVDLQVPGWFIRDVNDPGTCIIDMLLLQEHSSISCGLPGELEGV